MSDINPPRISTPDLAPPFEQLGATTARIADREYIVFAGCNYLGLAQDPGVIGAARGSLDRFGLSASASRQTSGNTAAHEALEISLAEFIGGEDALLVPDGYIANLAAAQALAGDHRVAVLDERTHRSLWDAARVAGLRSIPFRHLDARDAVALAHEHQDEGVVVMTDGVFAADGARAPVDGLLDSLPADRVRLILDDCHGFCVLGDHGRGTMNLLGRRDRRVVVTTTLAKGLGCAGGVIVGDEQTVRAARRGSSAFICTTPASPAAVCAAMAALKIVGADSSRLERLRLNADRIRRILAETGLVTDPEAGAFFAIAPGSSARAHDLHMSLYDAGVFVPLVRYPGGPSDLYLRLAVTSEHTPEQIDRLCELLRAFVGNATLARTG